MKKENIKKWIINLAIVAMIISLYGFFLGYKSLSDQFQEYSGIFLYALFTGAYLGSLLRFIGLIVSLIFIVKERKWAYVLISATSLWSISQFVGVLINLGVNSITFMSVLFFVIWVALLVLSLLKIKELKKI